MAKQQLKPKFSFVRPAPELHEDRAAEPDATGGVPIAGRLEAAAERVMADLESRTDNPPSEEELDLVIDALAGQLETKTWPAHLPSGPLDDELLVAYLENALPEHLLPEISARSWTRREVERLCELEEEQREREEESLDAILAVVAAANGKAR